MWVWISNPHFTVKIEIYDGKVVKAAPIVRWMAGHSKRYVKRYAIKHGWEWKEFEK